MKIYLSFFLSIFFYLVNAKDPTVLNDRINSCGPIPACPVGSINTGMLGVGITLVQIGQINNTSINNGNVGYQDFTCTDSATLNQGDYYNVEVITGQTYAETVRIWVDFGNDGLFDSTELIFDGPPLIYYHIGIAYIPIVGVLAQPLRMRVGSEADMFPPATGCDSVQSGQYEDYTVYLNSPTGTNDHSTECARSHVWPNPFRGNSVIHFSSSKKNWQLNVFNPQGALVQSTTVKNFNGEIKLNCNGLPAGIYFYQLSSIEGTTVDSNIFLLE